MYRSRDNIVRNNNKYELINSHDDKNSQVEKAKYINISYHVRKLFSYCDADIIRIENNLIIYNSLIDNIKKNGNRIVKKEVEKIVREKEGNENYCLKEMNDEEYKINHFELRKVELDFKFIECSLCFELIKFICVQDCNHTFCFLCFYRLLNMEKKEKDKENNNTNNSIRSNNSATINTNRNYNNTRNRNSLAYIENNESFNENSRSQHRRKDTKDDKYNYDHDKVKLKCPFCKEQNEYIFVCLNNFYTYFTYDNLLHTLLEKKYEHNLINESNEANELNEDSLKKNQKDNEEEISYNAHRKTFSSDEIKEKDKKKNLNKNKNEITVEEEVSTTIKTDLKKVFSTYYDDIIILRKILKKNEENELKINAAKKSENMYLFFYYEKYIKWKKKRIKYLLNCANSDKRYAFFAKIFLDTQKNIFYEYFYIFSLSTILTNYVCLLSPCIDYWTKIQNRKVEKYKLNNKIDKYFEKIYINNEKDILRKKNDSIYDRYQQHTKNLFYIKEESELSDDYFKVIDIFCKACFTNLDNINILNHLKYDCYTKLSDLCKHISEHNKIYCDICVGNSDNIFLFEYNIFHKRFLKNHIECGEKISENKYKVRHIYCHLCGFYLYDYDSYMNHINKYHFFCKFCFNKKSNENNEIVKNEIEEVIYYDELHLHVYRDYINLFEHYKKKHYPCLYEQCIFVVFDNKIDLCFHLAEKHEEKGNNKKNKITLSIAGASYSELRNNVHSNSNNNNNNRERENKNLSDYIKENDSVSDNKESVDIKNHKCIYNFKRFNDSWYFDYYIECKVASFIKYFSLKKHFFLFIIKTDVEVILSVFQNLSNNNSDLYFSQEEIIELNKNIINEDFPINKNNFFVFKLFFDYIIEKIEYLLYNKEDLEKNYLYLFFNIIINRSFILYYSFFFLYLSERYVNLEKVVNIDSKKNNHNSHKMHYIYKYEKDMINLRKIIESNTNVNLNQLSKYGFLYLIFLFFKVDKYSFEKICSFLKVISLLCNDTYNNINKIEKKEDSNNILIPIVYKKNENKVNEKEKKSSCLLNAIKSQNDCTELEDIDQLIKKCFKKKKYNNNVINNIYDKKWDISKKVVLDLLYYVQPNLNLVSFFYLFLNNYFSAYMKEQNISKLINISSENKKKILNRISYDVDLASLTSISKDLSSFVNAKALEECLSTGPEYYRIRKDIETILKRSNKNERSFKEQEKLNINDVKVNVNLYDISLSLRNRFLNIIKSTKLNELYFIYFYVNTIMASNCTFSSKNEEFPSLIDNNNSGNTLNNTKVSNSYKNKVEMNKEQILNSKNVNIDLDYPPLIESKKEDVKNISIAPKNNKKKVNKDYAEIMNHTASKNSKNFPCQKIVTNNNEKKKKNENNIKKLNNKNIDFNYNNYPILSSNNDDNKTKKNKNKNKNENKNKNKNNSKFLKSYNSEEFPLLPSPEENKKKTKNKSSQNIFKTYSSDEFPLLPTEENKKKSPNSNSNIKHTNNKKNKQNKCNKNIDSSIDNNCKSFINASEFNVTYTIKKKSKLKKCTMCTYENPYERTKCELCENIL